MLKEERLKTTWPWPEHLDALIADPEHHQLLLENEYVRVLDVMIRPGEITELHTHQWPPRFMFNHGQIFCAMMKRGL
jgi:hypothetical protein